MTLSRKIQNEILKIKYNKQKHTSILNQISKIIMSDNPKPRTISVRYSLIKKHFKSKTNNTEFLNSIRPPSKITETLLKQNADIRDNRKLIPIEQKIIEHAITLKTSTNMYDLAIFLLLVTGRRSSELLTGKYIADSNGKDIKMRGILKRTDTKQCNFTPLVKPSIVLSTLRRFRTYIKNKPISRGTFNRGLNRRIKKLFGSTYKPHTLRGVYVTYLFKFRNTGDLKINTFIKNQLCHQSINSSLNYTQYKLGPNITSDIIKN